MQRVVGAARCASLRLCRARAGSARRFRSGQIMSETASPARLIVGQQTRPHLPAYLKLRHDAGRARWILLAPEGVLTPDQTAVAGLKLCDGNRTVDDIVTVLAAEYSAPAEVIRADVLDLLQGLADKGYIKG